jgi:hypothetical protein
MSQRRRQFRNFSVPGKIGQAKKENLTSRCPYYAFSRQIGIKNFLVVDFPCVFNVQILCAVNRLLKLNVDSMCSKISVLLH